MAVNLRWAAALACAVGVRGKHSTPPVYSSTSLGRRLAASPPVDGAVAHLRANPNPPNPTRTLTLALARALTLARWLTSERKTSQYNQTKGCLCPLVMCVSALLPSQVKRTTITNNNTQGGGALLERVVLLVRVRHLPRHGCPGSWEVVCGRFPSSVSAAQRKVACPVYQASRCTVLVSYHPR